MLTNTHTHTHTHSHTPAYFGRFSTMTRAQVGAWARKALSLPDLVILDTETTGQWKNGRDEIAEICLIDKDGTPLLNTLVRPEGDIHPEAARISGITDGMVADAPRFHQIAQTIAHLVEGHGVVIYNAAYDTPLLQAEFQRCGMTLPTCEIRCAMLAYATYRQIPGRRPGEFAWHKLTTACAYERIALSHTAHRALGDCLATLALLRHMANGTPR